MQVWRREFCTFVKLRAPSYHARGRLMQGDVGGAGEGSSGKRVAQSVLNYAWARSFSTAVSGF